MFTNFTYEGEMNAVPSIELLRTFSSLPIRDESLLLSRCLDKRLNGQALRFGVIGCMPNILSSVEDGRLVYTLAPTGWRSTIDYKSPDLAVWRETLSEELGLPIELECLISDTEPRIKSDGLLLPKTKPELLEKANKVVKRVAKKFPGEVYTRSSVFPVSDYFYKWFFQDFFRELYTQLTKANPLTNVRVVTRIEDLTGKGLSYESALQRSLRDLALMDAEYAVEGLWIAYRSGWDAYLIIDKYPESSMYRTCRYLPNNTLPVLFPISYETQQR